MTMTYTVRRWRPRVRGWLIWRVKQSGGGITATRYEIASSRCFHPHPNLPPSRWKELLWTSPVKGEGVTFKLAQCPQARAAASIMPQPQATLQDGARRSSAAFVPRRKARADPVPTALRCVWKRQALPRIVLGRARFSSAPEPRAISARLSSVCLRPP